jgi:two-component system, cell cycle sensor histidine kinase and response regulator CckA
MIASGSGDLVIDSTEAASGTASTSPFALATSDVMLAVGVGAAAVLSAVIVWWPTQSFALAAGFLAAGLLGGAGLWSLRQRSPIPATMAASEGDGIDWALLRAVADTTGDALALTDKSGRLVCANKQFLEWFGGVLTPPNLPVGDAVNRAMATAGRNAWAIGSADIQPFDVRGTAFAGVINRVGRSEDHLLWRWFPANADDGEAAVLQQIAPALGGPIGTALDNAGVMAAVTTATGEIMAANRAFCVRAMGQADAGTVGRPIAPLLTVDAQGLIRFQREQGRDGTTPVRIIEVQLGEGTAADLLLVLIDEDGGAVERGIALDYVDSLLTDLPFGLAMVDRDGRFLFANASFHKAAGSADEKPPPRYPTDLVVADDKGALGEAIRRQAALATGTVDIGVRLRAGQEAVTLGLTSVRGIGEAAVLLSLHNARSETELKAQVIQAQKMQAVGQLAGGVAHDFNNILTGILGSCDLMLLRHAPGDSDYDDIQQIRSNTNRAANLTRQLLAFSRQQTLRPQILNMADVVADISHLLQRLIGDQVKLEVRHGRGLSAVRADPGQLEQVIVNLAVNARDAMPRGGTLTIATAPIDSATPTLIGADTLPPGRYAMLEVVDSGEGIPPDVLPKIFDPFFTTKAVGQGTGLGLATCYGIVKQSGGYIFAGSTPGQGTRFSVYLPAFDGVATPVARPDAPTVARSVQWGTGTILLVEDEDVVRAVAERALARAGYTLITAVDGSDGLRKFAENRDIDLIITDVMMPEMDGPTMAAHIREERGDLPVLFMSGYAEEQLRKSISLPNVGFLPKPFAVAQLIEAVQAVHGGSDAGPA